MSIFFRFRKNCSPVCKNRLFQELQLKLLSIEVFSVIIDTI